MKNKLSKTGSYVLTTVLIVTLILGLELVPVTFAAFPGENGKIAFTRFDGNDDEIFIMNPDGSDVTQLTNNDADDSSPAWSADGTKITFVSRRDGEPEIFTMNSDGTNQMQLTFNDVFDQDPCWSPDGTKIVFRRGGAEPGIIIINADGSGEKWITTNIDDENPVWSPDGTKIAFTRWDGTDWDIWTINPNGLGETQITPDGENDIEPDWSPDSSKIVFHRFSSNQGIYVINSDGTGIIRLSSESDDNMPGWSPDGKKIVFVNGGEGGSEIYVMNSDGTVRIRLTNNAVADFRPDWQPIAISPVGGVLIEVNKNIIIAPFLLLVGLAAVISILVLRKRTRI